MGFVFINATIVWIGGDFGISLPQFFDPYLYRYFILYSRKLGCIRICNYIVKIKLCAYNGSAIVINSNHHRT